jgi:hypothetical protein
MKNNAAEILVCFLAAFVFSSGVFISGACSRQSDERTARATPEPSVEITPSPEPPTVGVSPTPDVPDLQKEILDDRHKTTTAEIGKFDFKNNTFPLPRGWQDKDGAEAQLENGSRKMTEEKIGLSYVTTKFFDVTGDGKDEALVILKIVTAGSAIPQIVYIYTWKDNQPELIWHFRTGDRADGGLKDLRFEDGLFVVELYGQDRFLLGEVETGKVTGDEEQICCPTYFSRSRYKWNGKNFLMQGKRLTFTMADTGAAPVENLGDQVNDPKNQKKK